MSEQLVNIITEQESQGLTTEQVYTKLIGLGYQISEITSAYTMLHNLPISTENPKVSPHTSVVQIVSYIGAILIVLGIFSFIAANWQGIPQSMKVVLLLVLLCSSYAGAINLDQRGLRKTSGALFMLGALIFGASIFLIGQIFNVRLNWAEGFLYWMLGLIPLALITNRPTIWGILVVVGLVGASSYPFLFNLNWRYVDPQMFISLPMLLLSIAVPFIISLILRQRCKREYPEFY